MFSPKLHILAFTLSAALAAAAATTVSHVVVNQRWPWSEKVDIDFVLSGDAGDVNISAVWDAHKEPYALGTIAGCTPGSHRFTWDPAETPFAGQTLTGFTVTATNAVVVRNYAVIDLVNGGCTYLSAPPEGGWTDEHKSTKMVFRRIPAGTYTLGEPRETFASLGHWDVDWATRIMNRRTVTLTSDFYVGIFKYTAAQHVCLSPGADVAGSFEPVHVSYNELRGAQPEIDWPTTGYKVAEGSVVAKLREKAGEGVVVDLCEEEQWEAAARAGAATFWPNGGTADETVLVNTDYLNDIAVWYGNTGSSAQSPVGLKKATAWGLYDIVGLDGEWALDTAEYSSADAAPSSGLPAWSIDPTGASQGEARLLRSATGNWWKTAIYDLLPCRRQMAPPGNAYYSTRFCIHLKPLGNLTFEGL